MENNLIKWMIIQYSPCSKANSVACLLVSKVRKKHNHSSVSAQVKGEKESERVHGYIPEVANSLCEQQAQQHRERDERGDKLRQ